MKVIAINGSPRKTWNTATLLQKALDGAAAQGADAELPHLYDLTKKGTDLFLKIQNKSVPFFVPSCGRMDQAFSGPLPHRTVTGDSSGNYGDWVFK
jgi:hypothetical protein